MPGPNTKSYDRGRLMWVIWALIFGLGIGFFTGYYLGVNTAQTVIEEGIVQPVSADG